MMNKFEAQGEGGWSSWIWFFKENGLKTFVAFSFFYFLGWQMYHVRKKLLDVSASKYFLIWITFWLLLKIPTYSLYYMGYNNPNPIINKMHRNIYGLNDGVSISGSQKQKVTFKIDMSEENVVAGSGDSAAVYICVAELG